MKTVSISSPYTILEQFREHLQSFTEAAKFEKERFLIDHQFETVTYLNWEAPQARGTYSLFTEEFTLFWCISGVYVTDLGSPPLSNSTIVVINIAPVNEFSPQLTHDQSAVVTVKENYDPGNELVLMDVNATDNDFGVQGKMERFTQKHFTDW